MSNDQPDLHTLTLKANEAKDRLIRLESDLRDAGFTRKANTLSTIIRNLEHWQNVL